MPTRDILLTCALRGAQQLDEAEPARRASANYWPLAGWATHLEGRRDQPLCQWTTECSML